MYGKAVFIEIPCTKEMPFLPFTKDVGSKTIVTQHHLTSEAIVECTNLNPQLPLPFQAKESAGFQTTGSGRLLRRCRPNQYDSSPEQQPTATSRADGV